MTMIEYLMALFQESNYLEQKKEHMSSTSMTNKVKERIGFHYLLTEIWLHAYCIYWDCIYSSRYININKIKGKSITHKIFRIHVDNTIMCGFCLMAFIEYMSCRKPLLDYSNLFSPDDYKKNE